MKDQPPRSPHHGPPVLYRSSTLALEERKSFRISLRSIRLKVPISLWLIGIGVVVYAVGFGRLVSTVLEKPSTIDQVPIVNESNLGFAPYLVSSESARIERIAPTIPVNLQGNGQAQLEPQTETDLSTNGMRKELLFNSEEGAVEGEAEDPPIWLPNKLIIPKIKLDTPIEPVSYKVVEADGKTYEQWFAPDSPTVGWHETSARLGTPGNTILNGHHNIFGEIFRDLSKLEVGDRIMVLSGARVFEYVVGTTLIVPERYQTIETRLENARWIQPSNDERITLVTCWPYESNTHRVIVVAVPVEAEGLGDFKNNRAVE